MLPEIEGLGMKGTFFDVFLLTMTSCKAFF